MSRELKDPLEEKYAGLSLFTGTFSSLPSNPHDLLISLPVKDPEALEEKAEMILSGTCQLPPEKQQNDVSVGGPRGRRRRPGLGLKRARPEFRLRSETRSEGNVILEPSLDIDKLKDPEEFFAAFERLQLAKREIAKQTGCALPEQQYGMTWEPRPHRPGLPGRSKTYEYKHLYPVTASQEALEENITSAFDIGSEQAAADVDAVLEDEELESNGLDEGEQAASVAAAENQVTKLLHELLSCDDEELDGDGAMNLLRERLNIKPCVLEKLKLPEMPDIQGYDLNTPYGELTKQKNALSYVQNILKETRSKASLKQKKSGVSVPSPGSPTPPRSPSASLSLLRRSIMRSDRLSDPVSAADVANSPARDASPMGNIDLGSALVDAEKDFHNSTTSRSPSNKPIEDVMTGLGTGRDDGSEAFSHSGNITEDNGVIEKNLSLPDADVQENGPNELKDMELDTQQEAADTAPTDSKIDDHPVQISDHSQNQLGETVPAVVGNHGVAGCIKTKDSTPEKSKAAAAEQTLNAGQDQTQYTAADQHIKRNQRSSVTSLNEQTNAKTGPRKERRKKPNSLRRSLAGSGTSWEGGVRRSTRIRSRPLEYWKGERFLYGRIHNSLVTVIGIKCESPENGKPIMKVKSFVSEEHKHLLDDAALY